MVIHKIIDNSRLEVKNEKQLYDFDVNSRVKLFNPSGERTGVVCYIGETILGGGPWVGVKLDKKTGENDGRIKSIRYFTCTAGHGIFVRPSDVKQKANKYREILQTGDETSFDILDVIADTQPLSRLLNEICRAFECRICLDYKKRMLVCDGCRRLTICQPCHKKWKNGIVSCPGCLVAWKPSSRPIRSDFFTHLLSIACDVQQEYNWQKKTDEATHAKNAVVSKKNKKVSEKPLLKKFNYQSTPSLSTLLHEIARLFKCGVCRSHKPSMVLCGGCGYLSVCYDCMKNVIEKKEEKNHCPVCYEPWNQPSSSSRVTTRAFQDIVKAAADVENDRPMKKKSKGKKGKSEKTINETNYDDAVYFRILPDTKYNETMRNLSWLESLCYFFTGKL